MPPTPEARSLAVFCDFENIALGVREAKYAQFDMEKVLERLQQWIAQRRSPRAAPVAAGRGAALAAPRAPESST